MTEKEKLIIYGETACPKCGYTRRNFAVYSKPGVEPKTWCASCGYEFKPKDK